MLRVVELSARHGAKGLAWHWVLSNTLTPRATTAKAVRKAAKPLSTARALGKAQPTWPSFQKISHQPQSRSSCGTGHLAFDNNFMLESLRSIM